MRRIYEEAKDLLTSSKMLFVTGPRQVGKTTFSKNILLSPQKYLNWDIPEQKKQILDEVFTEKVENLTEKLLILDEIHKYHRFKNSLKGLYDRGLKNIKIVVTGSARLDHYQKSGDSLLGRYEILRLHPLSLGELTHSEIVLPPEDWLKVKGSKSSKILNRLKSFGGFPEPYLKQDDLFYKRWQASRRNLLIREDLRDIAEVKLLSQIEEFGIIVPSKVGSLLSINSLREDLGVSHDSIEKWLNIFEQLYYVYRIKSFQKKVAKTITKAQKLYMWDWAEVEDKGAQLENLVAGHLMKNIHLWNDLGYGDFDLNYLRTKDNKEIDFLILNKRRPIVAIEVKSGNKKISDSWARFSDVLEGVPRIQLTENEGIDETTANGIRIVSIDLFLSGLN